MNISFFKEVLNSSWSSLREECRKSSDGLPFNKCCSLNLIDSRDTDFNKIENRISYMYKFGNSVMILVETCIINFFNECSKEDMIYFSKYGKMCSLSNGPGLDIIGYLSALIKSNKQLNYYPIIKGINLYESWRDLFQRVASFAHECCSKSYLSCGYDQTPLENINFLQCDIFSALSSEAKEYIENSDILLMCKVFSSTKATPEIVANTLKEILTLLKPGSIVFFIGSKKNVKNVSTLSFFKKFVNIQFGPIKVTLENVLLDASISGATGLKPEHADNSCFMVLQKKFIATEHKDLNTSQEIPGKTKKRSRGRKKKHNVLTPSVSSCDISITDGSKGRKKKHNVLTPSVSSCDISITDSSKGRKKKHNVLTSSVSLCDISITDSSKGKKKKHNVLTPSVSSCDISITDGSKRRKKKHNVLTPSVSLCDISITDSSKGRKKKHNVLTSSVSLCDISITDSSKGKKKKHVLIPSVSSCDISITNSSKVEDTDIDSSISVSSSCKQSDITSDESKSISYENLSQLEVTHVKEIITPNSINKKELSENLPYSTFQTKLQTFLNKNSSMKHSYNTDEPVVAKGNIFKPILENAHRELDEKSKRNNTRNMPEENVSQCESKSNLMEIIGSYSNNKDDSLNKIIGTSSSALIMSGKKISNASVEFEKPIESERFNINDPDSEMASTFQFPSPVKYIPPHKRSVEEKSFSESTLHMEQMKSVNITDCLEREKSTGSGINLANRTRRKFLKEISTRIDKSGENLFQIVRKNTDCHDKRKQKISTDTCQTLFRDTTCQTDINNASFSGKELKTKTEIKQKGTRHFLSENSFHAAGNGTCAKKFIGARNKNAFHSMIEHCENLVTSLEGLVANISKNTDSMNDQSPQNCCCKTESHTNCRHLCVSTDHCYEREREQSYLRRNCCCKRIKNCVCMECPKTVCNKTCNHQMHTCNYDVEKSRNLRQPYLVLPVQNEDIPFILNLVSKNS